MRRSWAASAGALLVIALTLSILLRGDPLEYSATSYGVLPQGFGALQRRGTSLDYVKLEASHVSPPIVRETSMFETLGTGW